MAIVVLSLFDGISCGQLTLKYLGFKVDKYFASEINDKSINVTQHNFPETIQIGDVTKVRYHNGILHTENGDFDVPKIHMVIGGSPCQGFSFAGKQLNFEDPRSKLFFEYLRICHEVCPDYFFLENVKMKKESENVITNYLGVEPININSSLVSAQLRNRIYWSNIPGFTIPKDKGILLNSIIEDKGVVFKDKAYCLTLHTGNARDFFKKSQSNIVFTRDDKGKYSVQDNKIKIKFDKSKDKSVFTFNCPIPDGRYNIRPINGNECEKLQNIPVGYTSILSEYNRIKVLGDCWTIHVIAEFFKHLPYDKEFQDDF